MSKNFIVTLFIYYLLLLIVGIVASILSLLHETSFLNAYSILEKSVFASLGMASMGCSIFYAKKLYKACINVEVSTPTTDLDKIRQLGVALYFFLRPIFSLSFCLLILVGMRASILGATRTNTELDNGFIYLVMFISFFAGFSAGDLLDILEDFGRGILKSIFEKKAE